jgi:hypothetical protein
MKILRAKNILSILLGAALSSLSTTATAQVDYCELSDVRMDIHVFAHSLQTPEAQSSFGKGLQGLIKNLQIGDEIRFNIYEGSEVKAAKYCVPGCPNKGTIGNLFNSECSAQVAKKDKVQFNRSIKKIFKIAKDVGSSDVEYDVFSDLRKLETYSQGRDEKNYAQYAFHTTLPYRSSELDSIPFNSAFVRAVQFGEINDIRLPDVKFINVNQSKDNIRFWQDLGLNGNERGFNQTLSTEIID